MNKAGCTPTYNNNDIPLEDTKLISTILIYKGKSYRTVSVINQIPPHLLKQIGFRDPAQLQSFWDELVRRWPDTAESIINIIGDQAVWAEKSD